MTALRRGLAAIAVEYRVLLALLAGHLIFISSHAEVSLASSNMVTNLIRLESLQHVPRGALAFAGSSVTGRLAPSLFSTTAMPIVNIGLDGCATMDAATSLLNANQPPAILFLEMNAMGPRDPASFAAVKTAMSSLRMNASSVLPFLQAKERPIDLVYSSLNSIKAQGSTNAELVWREAISHPPAIPIPDDPDGKVAPFIRQSRETLVRLRNSGVTLAFLLVPDSYLHGGRLNEGRGISQSLAAELGIPLFDLGQAGNVESLSWTDGIHLTPAASREVVRFLEVEVIPRVASQVPAR